MYNYNYIEVPIITMFMTMVRAQAHIKLLLLGLQIILSYLPFNATFRHSTDICELPYAVLHSRNSEVAYHFTTALFYQLIRTVNKLCTYFYVHNIGRCRKAEVTQSLKNLEQEIKIFEVSTLRNFLECIEPKAILQIVVFMIYQESSYHDICNKTNNSL